MYSHLPVYPGDPILSLHEAFVSDERPSKANLGIGIYTDATGRLPVLPSVLVATERAAAADVMPCGYLPIEGAADYRREVQNLVFGADHAAVQQGRIATIQTVGGSGALRIGADFVKSFHRHAEIHLSDPSWENHEVIMQGAGLAVGRYRYCDATSNGLRFDDMLADWRALPPDSVVLIQPSCHNPTGLDLDSSQWEKALAVLKLARLVPFLDMAYQGFGKSVEADRDPIRAIVDAGMCPLVATSFSKNFSLYGERCGSLSVVCPTAEEARQVLGQLQAAVRRVYSSPPRHGARLVASVLGDAGLYAQWRHDVDVMRDRIANMRAGLAGLLAQRLPRLSVDFLTDRRGMFSYTGLTGDEVDRLRQQFGVYLIRSGRMCVAGLNDANLVPVADALAQVFAERPD